MRIQVHIENADPTAVAVAAAVLRATADLIDGGGMYAPGSAAASPAAVMAETTAALSDPRRLSKTSTTTSHFERPRWTSR